MNTFQNVLSCTDYAISVAEIGLVQIAQYNAEYHFEYKLTTGHNQTKNIMAFLNSTVFVGSRNIFDMILR